MRRNLDSRLNSAARRGLCCIAVMLCVCACARSAEAPAAGPSAVALEPEPAVARLVVLLIIDQLSSDTLHQLTLLLPKDGPLRRAMDEGAFFARSEYPYAFTLTAPGHATIATGVVPKESGVSVNQQWDRVRRRETYVVEDERCPVYSMPAEGKGPGRLAVETFAESLKRQSPEAKVVALSVKDRSSVFSQGSAGDLVLWYESSLGRFTSSQCYPALPSWLNDFHEEQPVTSLARRWEPLDPVGYQRLLGGDARPAEKDLDGMGTVFPQDLTANDHFLSLLRFTPTLTDYLFDLAERSVKELQLGQDATKDLLVLSVSGTDYAGHLFGPRSWEYADHLLRLDRRLAAFLATLDQGSVQLALTADHGVAPLPESMPPRTAKRFYPTEMLAKLREAIGVRFPNLQLGENRGIEAWVGPLVYFSDLLRVHPDKAELEQFVLGWFSQQEGIAQAYLAREVRSFEGSQDSLEVLLHNSLPASVDADVVLLRARGALPSTEAAGTHHGSPYSYDTNVPVIFWGAGVPKTNVRTPVSQLRIAPTLAKLLGIAPPQTATKAPLF